MAFTKELRTELVSLLGEDWVKDDPVTLYTYRCDGLTPVSYTHLTLPTNREV